MQEKIEFFKMDSGKISIEYNAISGWVIIINGNREILCQRDDPKFDIFKLFEVSSEAIQHIRALLDQTSIQNTEISLQLMAKVENKRQMYDLKLHTLWSPLKKDGYIGIVGYFDTCILFSICPVYAFAAGNQKEKIVRIGVPDAKYVKS